MHPGELVRLHERPDLQLAGRELRRAGVRDRPPREHRVRELHPGLAREQLLAISSPPSAAKYTSLPAIVTNRTHCIAWSDWASQPKVSLAHGIRLDTNYYYWPASWVNDRPGMFTGSGMPMRFADLDGTLIDVYQATTQMTDESGQSYSLHINALLDKAHRPGGLLRRLHGQHAHGLRGPRRVQRDRRLGAVAWTCRWFPRSRC